MTQTINTIKTINYLRAEFGTSNKYRYITKWLYYPWFYDITQEPRELILKHEIRLAVRAEEIFCSYRVDLLKKLLDLEDTPSNRESINWVFEQIRTQQFYFTNIIEYLLPNTKSATRPINTYFELLLLEATGLANTYKLTATKTKKKVTSEWKFRKNDKWFYNYINQRFRLALRNYITSEYSPQSLEYLNSLCDLICTFSKCRKFTPPSYDKLLLDAVYFGHTRAVEWLFNNTNKFIEYGMLNKDNITKKKLAKLFEKAAVHNYNRPELFRLLYSHFLMGKQPERDIIGVSLEEFMMRILVNVIDSYNRHTYYHPHLMRKWPAEMIDLLVELCPQLSVYLKRKPNGTFNWERLNSKFQPQCSYKIKVNKLNHSQ